MWSSHKRIDTGERVYGYFAPTRYLLLPISPSDVNKYSFFVSRPHFPRGECRYPFIHTHIHLIVWMSDRRPYNQIIRCKTDPQYDQAPDIEDLTMIYRPLFWTSFWCEDWLAASTFHGGSSCFIISSASSKTAFCLAYLIRKRFYQGTASPSLNIVGLTSLKNLGFTRSLGLYDTVIDYGELPTLFESVIKDEKSCVYVDVAGNDALNAQIRSSFSSHSVKLAAEIILGLTNLSPASPAASSFTWTQNTPLLDASRLTDTLPQSVSSSNSRPILSPSNSSIATVNALPVPVQFFMPEWLAIRRTQLSVAQITTMQADAWEALLRDGRTWISIERTLGGENVRHAFEEIEKDGVGPERGLVWSMWDGDETIETKGGALAKL